MNLNNDSNTEQLLNLIQELEELSDQVQNSCSQIQNLCFQIIHNYYNSVDQKLFNYRIMLEDNNFWQSRYEYLKIIEMFLDGKIDGKEFTNKFATLRNDNVNKRKSQESHLKTKTDFHFTSKSIGFSELISHLHSAVEVFDSNLEDWDSSIYGLSEGGLKNFIQKDILPEIQKYCEEKSRN